MSDLQKAVSNALRLTRRLEQIESVAKHVTSDEAVAYRSYKDPSFRFSGKKIEATDSLVHALDALGMSNAEMAYLVAKASKVSVASMISPFNMLEELNARGFSCIVDVHNEEYVIKVEGYGINSCIVPMVAGFPDTTALPDEIDNVMPSNEPIIALSEVIASMSSISGGVFKPMPGLDKFVAVSGYGGNFYDAMLRKFGGLVAIIGCGVGEKVYLDGHDYCHALYISLMTALADPSLSDSVSKLIQEINVDHVADKRVFPGPFIKQEGRHLRLWPSLVPTPRSINGKLIGTTKALDAQSAYEVLKMTRSLRGDNDSKKGEITRSLYCGINLPGKQSSICTESFDLQFLIGASRILYLRGDKSNHLAFLLESLATHDKHYRVYTTLKPNMLGVKVASDVAVDEKYPRYFEYGDKIRIVWVDDNYLNHGKCAVTNQVWDATTLIIDKIKKKESSAGEKNIPTSSAELSTAVMALGVRKSSFVTKSLLFSGICDKFREYHIYASCEYHNLVVYVTNYEVKELPEGIYRITSANIAKHYWLSAFTNIMRTVAPLTRMRPYDVLDRIGEQTPSIALRVLKYQRDILNQAIAGLENSVSENVYGIDLGNLDPGDSKRIMRTAIVAPVLGGSDPGSTSGASAPPVASVNNSQPLDISGFAAKKKIG